MWRLALSLAIAVVARSDDTGYLLGQKNMKVSSRRRRRRRAALSTSSRTSRLHCLRSRRRKGAMNQHESGPPLLLRRQWRCRHCPPRIQDRFAPRSLPCARAGTTSSPLYMSTPWASAATCAMRRRTAWSGSSTGSTNRGDAVSLTCYIARSPIDRSTGLSD